MAADQGRGTSLSLSPGWSNLLDNLRVARVWIWIHPAHQRHGVGTALSSYADARVRALGRSVCHAQARIGVDRANGNRAFADRFLLAKLLDCRRVHYC